jgi:hypothetical protein
MTAASTAAYFIAQNTALAQAPAAPMYFVGSTPAEIAAQNAQIAQLLQVPLPSNNQLIPYKPSTNPQFWCKELDGAWTLREQNDVVMGEIGPGIWERHPTSGYHYFVRAPAWARTTPTTTTRESNEGYPNCLHGGYEERMLSGWWLRNEVMTQLCNMGYNLKQPMWFHRFRWWSGDKALWLEFFQQKGVAASMTANTTNASAFWYPLLISTLPVFVTFRVSPYD